MSSQSFIAFNYHRFLSFYNYNCRERTTELKGTDKVENHNIIKALPVERAGAPHLCDDYLKAFVISLKLFRAQTIDCQWCCLLTRITTLV